MLKKAAFLINKCFVMSFKRRRWRRGEKGEGEEERKIPAPNSSRVVRSLQDLERKAGGMQRGAAQGCGFRPKASRTEDTTSERFFSSHSHLRLMQEPLSP